MEASQGGTVDHLLPCTASDKETCQIVAELHQSWKRFDTEQWSQCLELLERFLATHRCIGSISLKLSSTKDTSPALLSAVCQNRRIKTVSLADIDASSATTVFHLLPYLTSVEKLHVTPSELPPDLFVAPLSELLQASTSLNSLHISGKFADEGTIDTLFTALLRKPTLTELHFQDLSVHGDVYPQSVKEYIGSTNFLRVLSVTMRTPLMQMAVLEGVLENRSIENLSLDLFMGREEITDLVSKIIKTNRILRKLNISRSVPDPSGLYSVYDCWVLPLVENETLEEVTLPFSPLRSETWSAFFRALPAKQNLKKVHIGTPFYIPSLRWLCAELRRSGSEEKVSLEFYSLMYGIEFLHCKAFSRAELLSMEHERKLDALVRLPNCQHLKSIHISFGTDNTRLLRALAEFLRLTKTLQTLDISVYSVVEAQADGRNLRWKDMLESLSRNETVRLLVLTFGGMNVQDTDDLVDSVKRSMSIRRLSLSYMAQAKASTFIRRLSKGIKENFRLMAVDYTGPSNENYTDTFDAASDWLAVQETTWRNSGLVSRAARIKQASHLDRYVTGALERVARHPALLDEVALIAKLDRAELMVLVRDRLMQVRSMDGFMRAAGVVKELVICHPVDDGRVQLDDLNEDCWSHVRRYLVTDDVRGSAVQVDSV
ncbi:hypothetical protein MTO96_025069 [Rhipicephalus appendiculatus]